LGKQAPEFPNFEQNERSPQDARRASTLRLARPHVKLEARRQAVSMAVVLRSNSSLPDGPPAVASRSTAKDAKNAENMTMSLSRKIQNP
jgi:hypothetical protein